MTYCASCEAYAQAHPLEKFHVNTATFTVDGTEVCWRHVPPAPAVTEEP